MSTFHYYALSDKFAKYSKVNITFRIAIPFILFIFLIFIPIIEICITDVNRQELNCSSPIGINIVEWSFSKNIFIMLLSMLMTSYLLFSKHTLMRYFLRLSIFIANFFITLWLSIGIRLIYRDCYLIVPKDMAVFNFFNILLGILSVILSLYIVYDSLDHDEIPLLDATHV